MRAAQKAEIQSAMSQMSGHAVSAEELTSPVVMANHLQFLGMERCLLLNTNRLYFPACERFYTQTSDLTVRNAPLLPPAAIRCCQHGQRAKGHKLLC